MARDQSQRPMTGAEIETLREEMNEQRSEICAFLDEQGVDVSGWATDEADPDADQEPADSD